MKRKFPVSILLFLLIFSLILCFQFFREENSCIDRVSLSWDTGSGQQSARLFRSGETYYGFLPSYADPGALTVHADTGYSIWLDNLPWQNTTPQLNRDYTLTITNPWGKPVCRVPFVLMQSENIPALSIQLFNGSMRDIEDRKEESGRMTLIGADCSTIYAGDFEAFHIRGNHTATLPKKPYALKFSQEVDLLGSGGYTTYCLVANADDESRLRNKLVYETARELGLAHSPESMFVDLYVDDVYYGLYLLTDKVDVHENRINVNPLQEQTQMLNFFTLKHYDAWSSHDSGNLRRGLDIPVDPSDITGGYLLELEVDYRMEENPNTFISDSGQLVSIKYPAQCSAAQVNYIADFYQKVEDAVSDGTYESCIDLESWAKFYLIQEFFAQIDRTSIFFYKDSDAVNPKLYAGPVWDFDWSFGLSESYRNELTVSPYRFYFKDWGLFQSLWKQDSFRAAVSEIYKTEFYPILTDFLPNAFDCYEQQISAAHAMDKCRWDEIFTAPHGPYAGSLSGALSIMKNWVSQRTDCFREIILEGNGFVRVDLYAEEGGKPFDTIRIAPNGCLSPNKIPQRDGYRFAGWYDAAGNPLTETTKITKNTAFYAMWEICDDSAGTAASDAESRDAASGSGFFEHTGLTDYCVLLGFAAVCFFVVFQVCRDWFSPIRKKASKRSSQNEPTEITP